MSWTGGDFWGWNKNPGKLVGTLPESNSKFVPWQWMVEIQAFPLGWPIFRSKLLVSGSLESFFEMRRHFFRKHGNGIQWLYWIYNSWRKLFFPASMRYCIISNILEPARHWEDVWRCSVHFREGLLINLADSGCIFWLARTEGAGFRLQKILTSSW